MADPIITNPPTVPVTQQDDDSILTNFEADLEAAQQQVIDAERAGKPAPTTFTPRTAAPAPPPAAPPPASEPPASRPMSSTPETPTAPAPTPPSPARVPSLTDKPTKSDDWKALHKLRDDAVSRADKAEAELTNLRKLVDPEQVSALRKQNAEYDKLIKTIAAERHPEVEKQFSTRMEAALSLARGSVPPADADKLVTLLKQPDSEWRTAALEELVGNLSPLRAGGVVAAVAELSKLQNERQALSARANEVWTELQTKQAREQQARQEAYNAAFDKIVKHATDAENGLPVFRPREGDTAWNTEVQQRLDLAKRIYSGLDDPEEIANAALWAAAAPAVIQQATSLAQENAQLRAELQKLQGAGPTLDEQRLSSDTPDEEAPSGDYGADLSKLMQKAGAFASYPGN